MPSADSTALPPLYQNRLLNRLVLFCLGGLIRRIHEHYQRWCENLEQHNQALERGTRITVERYRAEIHELRQICGQLDSTLQETREHASQAQDQQRLQHEKLQSLEDERAQDQQHLTDIMERCSRLESQLLETTELTNNLQRLLHQQQATSQRYQQELDEQRAKNRELLTLIDTFRQERAEAVEQRDQRDNYWRNELTSLRRRLQQRDLELENLRVTLQRQEVLYKQRSLIEDNPEIPLAVIRRLLQLCHPDKHNGSEASLEATRWLTSQKQFQQRVH